MKTGRKLDEENERFLLDAVVELLSMAPHEIGQRNKRLKAAAEEAEREFRDTERSIERGARSGKRKFRL